MMVGIKNMETYNFVDFPCFAKARITRYLSLSHKNVNTCISYRKDMTALALLKLRTAYRN